MATATPFENDLYEHEKFYINGMNKKSEYRSVKRLSVHYKKNRYNADMDSVPPELIKQELAYKLGAEIISGGHARFEKSYNPENFEETYAAEINVVTPGQSYINMHGDVFVVEGEEFSNAELVEAVKNYYAERLI